MCNQCAGELCEQALRNQGVAAAAATTRVGWFDPTENIGSPCEICVSVQSDTIQKRLSLLQYVN